MPYAAPLLFTGDHLGTFAGQPTNIGNPGDSNFAMQIRGATAVGSEDDVFRLVWYQNLNSRDETFANGQMWRVDKYNPSTDPDGDPAIGNEGWAPAPGYGGLTPRPDLVADLGGGSQYIVFSGQSGNSLILDISTSFTAAPTNYLYLPSTGELTFTAVETAFCFAAGTLIETADGPRRVEDIQPGDLVMTRDGGLQPVRWRGARRLSAALRINPALRPIRIRAGALGDNVPSSDLVVSPQHRVLVRSKVAMRMFGAMEVMVAAKQLLNLEGIDIAEDMVEVEYVHLLFDRHEVVIANGAESESLYAGPEAIRAVGRAAQEEIFAIFPELRDRSGFPDPARPLVSGRQGRRLAMRHSQHGRPLVM